MSSSANTGFVHFQSTLQPEYVFIIIIINESDCFVSLPLRVRVVFGPCLVRTWFNWQLSPFLPFTSSLLHYIVLWISALLPRLASSPHLSISLFLFSQNTKLYYFWYLNSKLNIFFWRYSAWSGWIGFLMINADYLVSGRPAYWKIRSYLNFKRIRIKYLARSCQLSWYFGTKSRPLIA